MSNTYTSSNLPQQHQLQNAQQQQQQTAQSITYLPAHAHIQQHNSHQQQHSNTLSDDHLTATGNYFDARALEKTYANYAGGRYFTATSGLTNLPNPHNTILITNNFAHHQNIPTNTAVTNVVPQTHAALTAATNNYNNNNNIRILSAAATNNNNIFNLSKDANIDATLHLPHAHFFQTQQQSQQYATHLPNLQHPHQFHQQFGTLGAPQQLNQATIHFGNISATTTGSAVAAATTTTTSPSHFFTHATTEQLTNVECNKLPGLVDDNGSSIGKTATTKPTITSNNNSTVVLDRINICINNHYNDGTNLNMATTSNIKAPLSCATITTADNITQQQPSPVIPAIQHKPALLSDNVVTLVNSCSATVANLENNNTIHVIDEPDSTTTTAHTPPTTPNNATSEQNLFLNSPMYQSPTTTTAVIMTANEEICLKNLMEKQQTIDLESTTTATKLNTENCISRLTDQLKEATTTTIVIDCDENDDEIAEDEEEINAKEQPNNYINKIQEQQLELSVKKLTPTFKVGEDVLLKRQDNRFYLGTVIGNAHQQYLVRFDDQSEQWCLADEMRKLGGGGGTGTNDGNIGKSGGSSVKDEQHNVETDTPMCVACKRRRPHDVVECCERCGRGYHRGCTSEVFPGSGVWLCKRCAKPMKVNKNNEQEEQILQKPLICRQLPYHVHTLNWDEKHRVNEEQIYCYCGKTGKFDFNMLQCCKCKNWFHTHCMQNFKSKLLRGDR